jgi:Fe-S cluster biosynthesis and repair protein YggX
MSRTVQCVVLKTEAPGLDRVPYPRSDRPTHI